jgi:hypothetical protein
MFVSAAEDGSIVARSTDHPDRARIVSEPVNRDKEQPCGLAVSADGLWLAAFDASGVTVWPPAGDGKPIPVYPKPVTTVAFSPDRSRLLTTSNDGVTRIFSLGGNAQTVELPSETGCEGTSAAAFSPDGRSVGVANCRDVYLTPVENPADARHLGQHTGRVRSLAFSRDGTRVATGGEDGTRIWSANGAATPVLMPVLKGDRGDAGAAEKVVFSPDGAHVAVGYSKGWAEVMQTDGRGTPVTLANLGQGIRSLQFSPDGKYLLVTSRTGTAWIQEASGKARAMRVPRPPAPKSEQDGIELLEALRKGTHPAKRLAAVRACSFSPDARRIVAGYSDGTVAIHPGAPYTEYPGSRVEDLILLADLEATASTPNSRMAVEYLKQLNGAFTSMSTFRLAGAAEEATTYYVGAGNPVTGKRIYASLTSALAKAERVLTARHRVVLIVYASAHGWIGPDGRSYLLPSDADGDDPKTWIAYEDFLRPISEFLAKKHEDRTYVNEIQGDMSKLAIVILDTCQVRRDGNPASVTSAPNLSRPGLVVIQSTSPGRYAWHWTETVAKEEDIKIVKDSRWGFPPPPKAKRGRLETTLSTNMSVLPVASQGTLKDLIEEKASRPEGEGRMISASEWLEGTRSLVRHLLTEIPDAANPDLKEAAMQEVRGQADPRQSDFWLFRVEPGAVPKKLAQTGGADPAK